MASDIAALQARLDLQSAAFEKGMKSATKSLGRIERQSKKSGLAMSGLQKGMAKQAIFGEAGKAYSRSKSKLRR